MSDNVYRFVPVDAEAVVRRESLDAFVQSLAPAEADRVQVCFSDRIVLVDCGTNLSVVACPRCGADVLATGWWSTAMDHVEQSEMRNRSVVTPCCELAVNIERLRYEMPVAFGRWSVDVWNPPSSWYPQQGVESTTISRLQRTLASLSGIDVAGIWAHY